MIDYRRQFIRRVKDFLVNFTHVFLLINYYIIDWFRCILYSRASATLNVTCLQHK